MNEDSELVEPQSASDPGELVVYDFNHPQHRLGEPLAQLSVTGKRIAEELAGGLDTSLHVTGEVSLISTEYRKRQELIDSLDPGSCIYKCGLSPMSVDALVVIDRQMILSLVENFFGGGAVKAVKPEESPEEDDEEEDKEDEDSDSDENKEEESEAEPEAEEPAPPATAFYNRAAVCKSFAPVYDKRHAFDLGKVF